MKEQNKNYVKNSLIDSIIKSRQGEVSLKCTSPTNKISNINDPMIKDLLNKINIKELSRISNRNIYFENIKPKKLRFTSDDKLNKFSKNSRYNLNDSSATNYRNKSNNIKDINYGKYNTQQNIKNRKNIFILRENPKKLSNYILKNFNKKKSYKMVFLEEIDLDNENENILNDKISQYSNLSNIKNIPSVKTNQKNFYTFNSYNKYNTPNNLTSDEFSNYNNKEIDIDSIKYSGYLSNDNKFNSYFSINKIYSNNQNNDQIKIIKIQSAWKGYILRKYLLSKLNTYYNLMELFKILNSIFLNKLKPLFKLFLNSIYEDYTPKENYKINSYKKDNTKNKKTYYKKNSFNRNNENIKKKPTIDKKNINVFIPGNKSSNLTQKIYVKKNSIKKSKIILSENNIDNNNNIKNVNDNIVNKYNTNSYIEIKEKIKLNEEIKNKNSKELKKLKLDEIVKYITKKTYLLHFPLLSYRLRLLQKMNLIEMKYNYLSRLILIREKIILYLYFSKYRDIIFSQTINKLYSQKNNIIINNNKDNLNNNNKNNNINPNIENDNINSNKNNINNNKDNINNNKSHENNNILNNNKEILNTSKENIKDILNDNDNENNNKLISPDNTNNTIDNKKLLLSKIIKNKEKKIFSILHKYFNKWKNIVKKYSIKSKLKINKFNSNNIEINRYNTAGSSRKKHIKIKKLKSNNINIFSNIKTLKTEKVILNSFESDNIRKMKLNKINIFPQLIVTKNSLPEKFFKINSGNVDNSLFIQKIANISNKISNKNILFKFFIYWKKKTKGMK